MRAVTVTAEAGEKRLSIVECDPPESTSSEVTVAVKAFSLNNGEIRGALAAPAGYRPGWDFAGIVESAPTGSPFTQGDRVAGLKFEGAWAERVVVAPRLLAAVPDEVSLEVAATLPVAGVTALLALSKKSVGRAQKVLVTAATGGVGMFAIQLAAVAGAHVTAYVRKEADASLLSSLGADCVAIGEDEALRRGPYDLILDGVGGRFLGTLLQCLAPRGVCVQFGDAGGEELTTFDAKLFRLGSGGAFGGTSLYGFFLIEELTRDESGGAGPHLDQLLSLLRTGLLTSIIDRTQSWHDIDEVARALMKRRFKGKAVLRID